MQSIWVVQDYHTTELDELALINSLAARAGFDHPNVPYPDLKVE